MTQREKSDIEREKLSKSIIIHGRLIQLTVHSCSIPPTHCKPLVALEHPALLWMQALLPQTTMSDQLDSLEDLFTLETPPSHLDTSEDLPFWLWLWHSTLFRLWYYTPVDLGSGTHPSGTLSVLARYSDDNYKLSLEYYNKLLLSLKPSQISNIHLLTFTKK